MEVDLGVFLEPTLVLLVRIEIVEDDVKRAIREGGNEAVHEAEKLDAAAALGMGCDDPAGSDFERGAECSQALSAPAGAIFAKLTGGEREPLQPVESSWPWSGAAAARAGYWLPWPIAIPPRAAGPKRHLEWNFLASVKVVVLSGDKSHALERTAP